MRVRVRRAESGVALPLEKHSGTVYRLGAKKLSLNIRSQLFSPTQPPLDHVPLKLSFY